MAQRPARGDRHGSNPDPQRRACLCRAAVRTRAPLSVSGLHPPPAQHRHSTNTRALRLNKPSLPVSSTDASYRAAGARNARAGECADARAQASRHTRPQSQGGARAPRGPS
eukprot:1695270-Prymnesium_polylepis.1